MKAKEFWLTGEPNKIDAGVWFTYENHPNKNLDNNIHVIEYSEVERLQKQYDKLMQDARVLREALNMIKLAGHSNHVKMRTKANEAIEHFDKKYPQLNEKE